MNKPGSEEASPAGTTQGPGIGRAILAVLAATVIFSVLLTVLDLGFLWLRAAYLMTFGDIPPEQKADALGGVIEGQVMSATVPASVVAAFVAGWLLPRIAGGTSVWPLVVFLVVNAGSCMLIEGSPAEVVALMLATVLPAWAGFCLGRNRHGPASNTDVEKISSDRKGAPDNGLG